MAMRPYVIETEALRIALIDEIDRLLWGESYAPAAVTASTRMSAGDRKTGRLFSDL